jgi:hypothetical protein
MAGVGVAILLLALGVVLLVAGIALVALAPVAAARMAATTTKPKLERRASGPDRMRNLIMSQRTERSRSKGLSTALTRTGISLGILSLLSLGGGAIAWFTG